MHSAKKISAAHFLGTNGRKLSLVSDTEPQTSLLHLFVCGQRPRNYSSCCSCWIFWFKNSLNLSLFAFLSFFNIFIFLFFLSFNFFYHNISLSFYYICLLYYLCQPTYVHLPTYLYQHTYLPMTTYQPMLTYLPLPTYVYLPTHVNLPSSTNLYQSLNINNELPETQNPVLVVLFSGCSILFKSWINMFVYFYVNKVRSIK